MEEKTPILVNKPPMSEQQQFFLKKALKSLFKLDDSTFGKIDPTNKKLFIKPEAVKKLQKLLDDPESVKKTFNSTLKKLVVTKKQQKGIKSNPIIGFLSSQQLKQFRNEKTGVINAETLFKAFFGEMIVLTTVEKDVIKSNNNGFFKIDFSRVKKDLIKQLTEKEIELFKNALKTVGMKEMQKVLLEDKLYLTSNGIPNTGSLLTDSQIDKIIYLNTKKSEIVFNGGFFLNQIAILPPKIKQGNEDLPPYISINDLMLFLKNCFPQEFIPVLNADKSEIQLLCWKNSKAFKQKFIIDIVIDCSGSIAGHLKNYKSSLIDFIKKLPENENFRFRLVLFSNKGATKIFDKPAKEKNSLTHIIENIKPFGFTYMFPTIEDEINFLKKEGTDSNNFIFLITDGDNKYETIFKSEEKVDEKALFERIGQITPKDNLATTIVAIGDVNENTLKKLTKETYGIRIDCNDTNTLSETFERYNKDITTGREIISVFIGSNSETEPFFLPIYEDMFSMTDPKPFDPEKPLKIEYDNEKFLFNEKDTHQQLLPSGSKLDEDEKKEVPEKIQTKALQEIYTIASNRSLSAESVANKIKGLFLSIPALSKLFSENKNISIETKTDQMSAATLNHSDPTPTTIDDKIKDTAGTDRNNNDHDELNDYELISHN